MAEIKTGIFAKNVQKRLNRAQEKVLQKLGKADETKDEQFEQVVSNFKRQESEGSRLQREMKAYMSAIKGMQQASINLTQSLHEVYEPDWHGKDEVLTIGKDSDALWEDFHNKLVDATLLNLDEYLQQFPDLKTRVAKRSRKLIDYDSARHHLETLQISGMKNDRKITKAEEDLRKAQRVFDELNVGLQDELPTLWDRRVGFYISTFKSVTSLEAKFHREISLVCRELYEVMTQLREQHSDKIFTIQGAPSDTGPLRLARTPSPPEDDSPPESPDISYNNRLHPVSPGPPRPKSPAQGPPVPPPPKATPTKELAEEQIIDLFGGDFLPAPSPSQPNERPGESLLDLDFDAFQADESVSPIPQTAVPWDMWSANSQPAQPVADSGFVAEWTADFGSTSTNGEAASLAEASTIGVQGEQGDAQEGTLVGDGETKASPQDTEVVADEDAGDPSFFADFDKMNDVNSKSSEDPEASGTEAVGSTEAIDEQDKCETPPAEEPKSPPFPSDEKPLSPQGEEEVVEPQPSPTDEVKEPKAPPSDQDEQGTFSESLEDKPAASFGATDSERVEPVAISPTEETKTSPDETATSEQMPIPSVVIEPASSNEGDDDRDVDIISPTTISDNGVAIPSQAIKHMSPSGSASGLPDEFLYKVETMHDFEAANSDELDLKRGDVVLVIPTVSVEDQDAGWLTGIKENDWLTLGVGAQKGLFPENFTQRLE
ncbi:amphiphysin isoform X5 [Oryzias latipes]